MVAKSKSNTLDLTRLYDAPVKAVWEAWTDPNQVGKWWGPRGFTLTTHKSDVRTGGSWSYTMHGPDGVDYVNKTQYLEVEKHQRLVYDHGGNDELNRPALFRVTVNFKEINGKTKMDLSMALATPEAAAEMAKFIQKAGGNATWDRLGEHLSKESTGKERFIINRTFDAPIDLMFKMWTDPNHFMRWLPPTGFDMKFIRADIKPGGSTFYSMTGHGLTMYGRAHYREIVKPHRLVYTQEFTDENENISRHPLAPTWPASMLTVVTFHEEGPNRTRVTITWEVDGNYTAEEMNTFIQGKPGMTQGWTGSFDKLEKALLEG